MGKAIKAGQWLFLAVAHLASILPANILLGTLMGIPFWPLHSCGSSGEGGIGADRSPPAP